MDMKNKTTFYQFFITGIYMSVLLTGCGQETELVDPQNENASFYALGNLPSHSNDLYSAAYDVSPDGAVVVGESSSFEHVTGFHQAFIWTLQDKEMRGLMEPTGTLESWANAAANSGSVIAGIVRNGSVFNGPIHAVRWEGNHINELDSDPESLTSANGISANGSVIVGAREGNAYHWSFGVGFTFLDNGNPNTSNSDFYASDISNDGSVIVGKRIDRAFRWENSFMTYLGPEPSIFSSAHAVSADGYVIVGERDYHAFRWKDGIMTDIGLLSELSNSAATDVSADGSIIVGYANGAFIWTESSGIQNLQEVLEHDYGLDLSGWQLSAANGISDDGKVIAGEGCNTNRDTSGGGSSCSVNGKKGIHEAWAVYLDKPLTEITSPSGNHRPVAHISSPENGGSFQAGTEIEFSGSAEDDEEGTLTGNALVWTSDIDGEIGTGESFTRSDLSTGMHTITLTATDAGGTTGSANATIEIEAASATICENFNLRVDDDPIEVTVGGTDEMTVFVDRVGDFSGQVELTLVDVEGELSMSDAMSTGAFDPPIVPGAASSSTFYFTMRADVPPGDHHFWIAGGSPMLEQATSTCTILVTFRVLE